MEQRCESCKFWHEPADVEEAKTQGHLGRCHRYPPVLNPSTAAQGEVSGDARNHWMYPVTVAEDGCGEHQSQTKLRKYW